MNRKERRAQKKQNRVEKKNPAAALVTKEATAAVRALLENGFYPEAKELFQILLELDPDNVPLIRSYANALFMNEDIRLARQNFSRILELSPENDEALAGLAACSTYMENNEEAMSYLNRLDNRDLAAGTLCQIGRIYSNLGKIDKAMECLLDSAKKQPLQTGAYYELQNMKKFTIDDPHVAMLQKVLENQDKLSERDRMMLNFTLGKVSIDLGETEKAFEYYEVGNAMKKKTHEKDRVERFGEYFDSVIKLFNADFVAKFKDVCSVKSDQPIFIVGMPRSGSTLIDQILSSHPQVNSFGEKSLFPQCVPVLPNAEVPEMGRSLTTGKPVSPSITRVLLDAITPEALEIMGNHYLKKTAPFAKGVDRVVDKMLFNHIWVGLIRLTLPNAKIIHCVRDPVDIGLSIWKLWFAGNIAWAYDLKEIGSYYNAYKKLMDHWHKLFPGEIFEARYEDMIADQEGQSRRLLEFCGLPWDDKVLDFHKSERTVKTASVLQVRKPIYTDSVKKWKKFEKYLQPLIQEVEKSGPY